MDTVTPLERVAELALDLAIILVAAKIGGEIAERLLKQPAVLGELAAGILISPFALGGWHIGSLAPLFEVQGEGVAALPVASELYFIAQIAAVVLLFQAGLETNRQQFFRYVRPATIVAMGGVILPFVLGMMATVWFGYANFHSLRELIPGLFVGATMTATSVGITARVLADMRKLDTPEGVTVLGAAVVDDVLGIIILAIVVGIYDQGTISGGSLALIFVKAVGFWLGLTVIGSFLAVHISNWVSWFKGSGSSVAIALAMAFLAGAVAESSAGLAMIIGSYSIGLALSATELKHRIEEQMRHINYFMVPLFFVVIGMQVDFTSFGGGGDSGAAAGSVLKVALFTVVICLLAIFSKVAGCGLPALGVGFNRKGAMRIGIGMLPRGEVALIVAGIGLGSGVITRFEFGVVIVMTVVTTVLAPVFLVPAFKKPGSGLRKGEAAPVANAAPAPEHGGGSPGH